MVDRSPLIIDGSKKSEFDKDVDDLLIDWGNLNDVDMTSTPPINTNAAIFDGTNWTPVRGEVITQAPDPIPALANTYYTLQVNGAGTGLTYFQEFEDFANRTDGLINQTTAFETFLQKDIQIPALGNYAITTSYIWSLDNQASDFRGRLLANSNTIFEHRQEPKDSAGGGITLPNTGGGNSNTGTDQRHLASNTFILENVPSGILDLDFEFTGSSDNQSATVYQASIMIRRLKR